MLASTVQFSSNPPTNPRPHTHRREDQQKAATRRNTPHHTRKRGWLWPVSSGPNSVPSLDVPPMSNHQTHVRCLRGHLTPPMNPDEAGDDVVSSLERR